MNDDDLDRPMPALGSAASPPRPQRKLCPAGDKPIDPITGECPCCSD